jgi:hypothetical protein
MDQSSPLQRGSEKSRVTIRDLFPNLSEDQLKEVEETLHNYAAIAWRVCERLEREKAIGFDGRRQFS